MDSCHTLQVSRQHDAWLDGYFHNLIRFLGLCLNKERVSHTLFCALFHPEGPPGFTFLCPLGFKVKKVIFLGASSMDITALESMSHIVR